MRQFFMEQIVIKISPVEVGIVVTEEVTELGWPCVYLSDKMLVRLQPMDHIFDGGEVLGVVRLLEVYEPTLPVL